MRAAMIILAATFLVAPAQARPVTDMAGHTVEIPDRVARVACLEVLCYPRMLMLGAEDRVVQMYHTAAPWMHVTNPRMDSIAKFSGDPNIEDLLTRQVDVAFFRYTPEQTVSRLRGAGIPALLSQPATATESAQDFLDQTKQMVRLFGAVLGGEPERRAEEWCAYFDDRVRFVRQRVATIAAARRVSVYYVRGPQALSTQGRNGYTTWAGEIAGARMVVRDAAMADKGVVAMEDVLRWNPQVVLVGRQYPLEVVTADPRWQDIAAVRSGRVIAVPNGVFYWDGGPESVLLIQFMAKLLYPDLFADFDMAAEVKAYYARFYRTALSDADVANLLDGRSPDGSRANPMNN